MAKTTKSNSTSLTARRPLIVALAVVIVAAIGVSAWAASKGKGTIDLSFAKASPSASPSPSSKDTSPKPSSNGTAATPTPATNVTPVTNGPAPNPPTGDLLNTHSVALSGSTSIETTCQTVAGITCAVQARNTATGQVISPKSATTDGTGNAILDWDAKSLGAGTWEIRLVATSGGKSTTSTIYDTLKVTS